MDKTAIVYIVKRYQLHDNETECDLKNKAFFKRGNDYDIKRWKLYCRRNGLSG